MPLDRQLVDHLYPPMWWRGVQFKSAGLENATLINAGTQLASPPLISFNSPRLATILDDELSRLNPKFARTTRQKATMEEQIERQKRMNSDHDLAKAVRQRVSAHPQARVQEIAAMLELDGLKAPVSLVQQIMDEQHTPLRADIGLVHAPPAMHEY